jgi:hypothetical protein
LYPTILQSIAYGYIPSAEIVVRTGGNENDFHGIAGHINGDSWCWINPKGEISKLEVPELNIKKQLSMTE